MSHFDEMSCLLYLDGQLDSLKTRELELHMRSCSSCKALLAALQRESALLHQAMLEEEESVPARLLAPPAREGVPWGWIISLGFAALGAFTVWTTVIEPWQANLSKAGFGGGNLLTMLFFSGVFWKGWSEMTTVLQVLAAITLGAPIVFLLWRKRRHLTPVTLVLAALAILLALPQGAAAAEIVKKDRYTLPAGETLHNDLVVFSASVRIEGTVDGDLIAFTESLTVDGHVTGDVIAFARHFNVNGTVDGSVRTATNSTNIAGKVARSLTSFSQDFKMGSQAEVGRGALLFSESAELAGRIARDSMLYTKRSELSGFVGGDFEMSGDTLSITSSAEVLGKAIYHGRKEPEVEAGAKLASPLEKIIPQKKTEYLTFKFYWDLLLGYASILALGTVLMLVAPAAFPKVTREARRPGALLGVVVLLAVPIAACVACITLVGFALGAVSILLWMVLLYVAQVYVAGAIGEVMLGAATSRGALFGRLAAGLAVLRVASALRYVLLPGLGTWLIFWGVVASWGIGAITLALYERLRWKPTLSAPAPAPTPAQTA